MINSKYLFLPISGVAFSKNNFILCNPASITNLKCSCFMFGLNFFIKIRIVNINGVFANRKTISVTVLIF